MLRSVIAIGLVVALQAGALTASLVHAHVGEEHHGHDGGTHVVHAHVGGHHSHHDHDALPASGPVVRAGEEPGRVTYLQVFLAVHSGSLVEPAIPPSPFSLPRSHESVMREAPEMVRSHGPPEGSPSEPRAPPAFLS